MFAPESLDDRPVKLAVTSWLGVFVLAVSAAGVSQRAGGGGASIDQPARQSIVGRVTNAAGQPVPNTYLTLLQDLTVNGVSRKAPVGVRLYAASSETGFYHFDNLQPGNYYVVALPQVPLQTDLRASRSANRITYFPGVATAAKAQPVTVTRAVPVRAEISLLPARLVAVSGSVIGSNGRPLPEGRLSISHAGELFGIDGRQVAFGPAGAFTVLLPPGTYHLHSREDASVPVPTGGWKVSGARLVVADRDLAGVRVSPIPMVTVTGRVVIDPAMRELVKRGAMRIGASPVDFDGNPGPQVSGTVRDDLTFEFRTWPSRGVVRVHVERRELVPRIVKLNGTPVARREILFVGGRSVTGLEVDLRGQPPIR